MPRRSRIVVEGCPHHIIQRGNRRQKVFFCDDDRRFYLNLLRKHCERFHVRIWAYCLMDNHVHLVAVPADPKTMSRALSLTHKAYSSRINQRYGWRGYLWQGRFLSAVMDDEYLARTMRYIEMNPVRAGIVIAAEEYPWSSAGAHVRCLTDRFLDDCPLVRQVDNWRDFLSGEDGPEVHELIVKGVSKGGVIAGATFIDDLSRKLNVPLMPRKRGPKAGPKAGESR